MKHSDLFRYDNGTLLWVDKRPAAHFSNIGRMKTWEKKCAGRPIGTMCSDRYLRCCVGGRMRLVHRVIWEMHHGPIQAGMQIDHINGVKHDNRIENLRLATSAQNRHNVPLIPHGITRLRGVDLHKASGLYRARIKHHRKEICIGYFKNPEAAHAAYLDAVERIHSEFRRMP